MYQDIEFKYLAKPKRPYFVQMKECENVHTLIILIHNNNH